MGVKRSGFIVPKNHPGIEKMLTFCVNKNIEDCRTDTSGRLIVLKLREGYEIPSYFKGFEKISGNINEDERFKLK